jgi:hypothetical protein
VADVIVGVSVAAGAKARGEYLAREASNRLSRCESILKDTAIGYLIKVVPIGVVEVRDDPGFELLA